MSLNIHDRANALGADVLLGDGFCFLRGRLIKPLHSRLGPPGQCHLREPCLAHFLHRTNGAAVHLIHSSLGE